MKKQSFLNLLALGLGLALAANSALATSDNATWNGGDFGTNWNWSNTGNWSGGGNPYGSGDHAVVIHFAGGTGLTPWNDYGAYTQFQQIYFDSGASSFTLGGNAIKLYNWGGTAKIENLSSSLQTVNFVDSSTGNGVVFVGQGELDPTQGDLTATTMSSWTAATARFACGATTATRLRSPGRFATAAARRTW